MKNWGKKLLVLLLSASMALSMCATVFADDEAAEPADPDSADNFIVGAKTEGFVDLEGAKVAAVILEYNTEIKASSVSAEDYEVMDYVKFLGDPSKNIEIDYDGILGNEGEITNVYVNNEEATSEEGGTETGKYVVIEVNTEYMLSGQNLVYTTSMIGGATQTGDVEAVDGTVIKAGTKEVSNYVVTESYNSWRKAWTKNATADKDKILLPQYAEGSGWTLNYIGDGAFKATNCYSEYTGEYCDFELPYSIYVPSQEVLEANKGNIALVVHMEHAGSNDTDPMAAITSSKAAAKLSSEEIQSEYPAIVVVPQVEESRRSTDDYDATSEVNTAVWELLDWLIEDEYADYIDTNRIYGTGQSMGGMTILQMAAQRDNFFAGIAVIGAQWSNNYDKPYQHDGSAIRTPDVDPISFDIDGDQGYGNTKEWYEENFENWYYMISDDNIFVHTCIGDSMSYGEWNDLAGYFENCGVEIPYVEYDPYEDVAVQDAIDAELTDHDNTAAGSGINWSTFTRGSHMSTWKYAYNLNYSFQWLFTQTKESEDARDKVEALANEYLGRDEEGNWIEGSGTKNMNSPQYGINGANPDYPENWKPGITSVEAVADVDADGAKTNSIKITYAQNIDADSVSLDDYEIEDYDILNNTSCELGENPGKATGISVDGNVVTITVNTDYQRGSVPTYTSAMAVGVKQVGEITSNGYTVNPGDWVRNYTVTESAGKNGQMQKTYTAEEGTYVINNITGYQLFTKEDGTAYHATNCFEEADGTYVDVDLPYALYVPEDYDPNGNYGLVLQIHDAGTMGDDPVLTLTESQACANFASEEVQQMAKDAGMDGLIVVAPMINDSLRSTRDNYTMSAAVPATWQLLDYITETYTGINMDRIFGTGQSMGGMQVIAMAAQRDNYFAGIWENGCQWGSNYAKDEPYPERGGGYGYYYMSKDDTIWRTDADGNDSDYGQNFYYLISDDNVLISNCQGDAFSTTVWQEVAYLYEDIAGVEIPYTSFNPLTDSLDVQNQAIDDVTSIENNGFGMYWYAYSGGSHMLTWIYGHKLDSAYKWLLNQTRESEQERSKLTQLANDWAEETDPEVVAEKQHQIGTSDYYFAVPAEGAGTKGYNAGWFGMQGTPADDTHLPGWVQKKIVRDEYGNYFYYEGGKINTEKYGFVTYDGGSFLVANGLVARDINGLAQDPENPSDWYYISAGQVVDYTGMIEYDGQWFYVTDGKLDTTYTGLAEYDGGTFLIAAGRLVKEANGLVQVPDTGKWVYVANGQVQTQYTGLVLYEGVWFYVENGVFNAGYTGTVVYDGSTFEVENGMLKIALNVRRIV